MKNYKDPNDPQTYLVQGDGRISRYLNETDKSYADRCKLESDSDEFWKATSKAMVKSITDYKNKIAFDKARVR